MRLILSPLMATSNGCQMLMNISGNTTFCQTISTDEGIMYSIEQGSMPKWDGVDDVFAKLAKAFPDLEITIDEACEEPSFPSRTLIFKNGKLEKTLWGRTLEPEQYDRTTIDAIISALRAANMTEAADYISNMGLA